MTLLIAGVMLVVPEPAAEKPMTKAEFQAAYKAVSIKSQRRNRPNPAVVVPELVRLYNQIPKVKLTRSLQIRYQKGLEYNLKKMKSKLVADRNLGKLGYLKSPRLASGKGGGSVQSAAAGLIKLIQDTIAPNSWNVNGGEGSIGFWPNPPALIIRAAP